jgi:hypothetical protein
MVVSGMEHVDAMSEVDTPNSTPESDGSGDKPVHDVRLLTAYRS